MRAALLACLVVFAGSAGFAVAGAAEDAVTMRARSTVVRSNERAVLLGTISSGQANEYVAVQGKECGVPGAFFRALGGASTTEGGAWTAELFLRSTTTLRAVWNESSSETVVVRPRMNVWLLREGGRFRAGVSSEVGDVGGKRLLIQRLTPDGWKRLRTLVVRSLSYPGWAERTGLRLEVPRGTTLRAFFPLSQARPCYLAGYSKLVRA